MEAAKRSRRSRLMALAVLGLTAFSIGVASPASATKPDANGVHKVTICHRTNSDTNPYVVITVDYSAANGSLGKGGNDHTHHEGDPWAPGMKDAHEKWGDIIPPYTYSGGSFPGMNWSSATEAFHAAGCTAPPACPPGGAGVASLSTTNTECPPECPDGEGFSTTNTDCPTECPDGEGGASFSTTNTECPEPPCPFNPSIPASSTECPAPCPDNQSIPITDPSCKPFG